MSKVLLAVLCVCGLVLAGTRTEVAKVLKPDTTIKVDTSKVISVDTIKIIKTYKDTSILIKIDTIKVPAVLKKADTTKAVVKKTVDTVKRIVK